MICKKLIAGVLAYAFAASGYAAPRAASYADLSSVTSSICQAKLESRCWQPLAVLLEDLKPAETEREHEDQFFGYLMLAKAAHWSGDFPDAKRYFSIAFALAKDVKPNMDGVLDADIVGVIVHVDSAALAMSMHDYEAALHDLDAISSYRAKHPAETKTLDSASLMRCAALIGLKRNGEADLCLHDVMEKLDFAGTAPWEGFPFGPQALNPYRAARRIAAHHMRNGSYEQALAVLHMIEARRTETLAKPRDTVMPGGYWAATVSAADIQEDEATVYAAQGKDDLAEPLLRTVLQACEKTPGIQLQRVLTRLAAIDRRAGRTEEAGQFAARAANLKWEDGAVEIDPLATTLGYAQ